MNETRSLKFDKILPQGATRAESLWLLRRHPWGFKWLAHSLRAKISNELQVSVAHTAFSCKGCFESDQMIDLQLDLLHLEAQVASTSARRVG
jgi:hypothetical protein